MFCSNCGAKLEEGELFCSRCGTRADEPQPVPDTSEETVSAAFAEAKAVSESASPVIEQKEPQPVPGTSEETVSAAFAEAKAVSESASPVFKQEEPQPVLKQEQPQPVSSPEITHPSPAEYVPQPVEVKPVKTKKRMNMGGTAALCILFGIFIFAVVAAASALFSVRTILSQERISKEISETNPASVVIGDILLDEEVIASLKDAGVDTAKIDEDTTAGDFVGLMFPDEIIRSDDIEELLDESGIMSEFGTIAAAYERYILTGEDSEPLSAKKLISLIDKYKNKVREYTGLDLSYYSIDIEESINEEKSAIKKLNPDYLFNGAGRYTSMALSLPVVIAAAAAAVLLAVLLGVITKRFCAPTLTLGICCTVCGVCLAVGNIISFVQLRNVLPVSKGLSKLIADFTHSVCEPITLIGAAVAGVGVLLIVTASVVSAVSRKKQAKS